MLGSFTQAQKYLAAARRFKAEAQKWRQLKRRSGLFTQKRKMYAQKEKVAEANMREQMRLYRSTKRGVKKDKRAAKRDARVAKKQGGQDVSEDEFVDEAELPEDEEALMTGDAPSGPSIPWTPILIGGSALVALLAFLLPRASAAPPVRLNPRHRRRRRAYA